MSLLYLDNSDFHVNNGTKDKILCTSIQGYSLIFFYAPAGCNYCTKFIPIFKTLPVRLAGCKYGMVNVSVNKECIQKSKITNTPIQYVPLIIFYVNGRPYIQYKGPADINEISRFITDVIKNIKNKTSMPNNNIKEDPRGGIPAYSLGVPLCGDEVCYLDFKDAYLSGKK